MGECGPDACCTNARLVGGTGGCVGARAHAQMSGSGVGADADQLPEPPALPMNHQRHRPWPRSGCSTPWDGRARLACGEAADGPAPLRLGGESSTPRASAACSRWIRRRSVVPVPEGAPLRACSPELLMMVASTRSARRACRAPPYPRGGQDARRLVLRQHARDLGPDAHARRVYRSRQARLGQPARATTTCKYAHRMLKRFAMDLRGGRRATAAMRGSHRGRFDARAHTRQLSAPRARPESAGGPASRSPRACSSRAPTRRTSTRGRATAPTSRWASRAWASSGTPSSACGRAARARAPSHKHERNTSLCCVVRAAARCPAAAGDGWVRFFHILPPGKHDRGEKPLSPIINLSPGANDPRVTRSRSPRTAGIP